MVKILSGAFTGLLSLSAITFSASSSAGLIDSFNTTQGSDCFGTSADQLCVRSPSSPNTASSYVNDINIFSGQRDIFISSSSPDDEVSGVTVNRNNNGTLEWNNNVNADSTLIIQYDGDDTAASMTGQNVAVYDSASPWDTLAQDGDVEDLTWGGATTGLGIDVLVTDIGFDYEILVTDIDGDEAKLGGSSSGNIGLISLLFADFINAANVDFTQIDNLQVTLNTTGVGSVNLQVDSITKVPEPTVLTMFGAGILALGFTGYRRKEQE